MPDYELERRHIDQFLRIYCENKRKATSQAAPEPDFVVDFGDKLVGIEHTRLLRLPDNKGIDLMAHSQIAERIVNIAESIFNTSHNLCLNVSVDFKCDYGLYAKEPTQLYNSDIVLTP